MPTFRRLLGFLRPYRRTVIWSLAFAWAAMVITVVVPLLIGAAVDAINGKELPKNIDTGFYWYDKTNINDPEIQAVLYK